MNMFLKEENFKDCMHVFKMLLLKSNIWKTFETRLKRFWNTFENVWKTFEFFPVISLCAAAGCNVSQRLPNYILYLNKCQLKNQRPDPSIRGGHVHFNLHRDQFSSDCQTVWDGSLPECYKAANFFIWSLDAWKLKF